MDPKDLDPKDFRAPPSPSGLQRCARQHHSCLSSLLMARCHRRSLGWPRLPSARNSWSRSEQDSRETGAAERLAAERGDTHWLRGRAARIKARKSLREWGFVVCCGRDTPRDAAGLQGSRHGSISLGAAPQQGVGRARHRPEFRVGAPERTTVNPGPLSAPPVGQAAAAACLASDKRESDTPFP